MCSDVFLKVTECGKEFHAPIGLTVERLAVVQPFVGPQTVQGVEGLLAAVMGAFERFHFRVDADVYFQTVGRQESLAASGFRALEPVLAWDNYKVRFLRRNFGMISMK